jgi:ribose-phosphate pyrophosphokinase
MDKIIISGINYINLAKRIGRRIKAKFISLEYKKFPDGELYLRLKSKINNENVILVETLYPQNDSIVELLFLLDLINEFKPKSVTLVLPYFAYARQHKRYRNFEVISAKTLAKLIQNFEINKIITVNLHSEEVIKFFDIPVVNLAAEKLIAEYFLNKDLKNPFVLIPDQEREVMAINAAEVLKCEYSFLKKYRSRVTGEIKTEILKDFDLKIRDVIILDDIISSGKTMLNAIKIAKKKKARNIFVSCVHYIPSNIYKKFLKLGVKEVVATNTIPSEISKIDISPLISKEIENL